MATVDKDHEQFMEWAKDNDPMFPIIVAGEAIANVLLHAQTVPDLHKLSSIPLPLNHIVELQHALGMLTQVIKTDNESH